jgi:hypothetical protein
VTPALADRLRPLCAAVARVVDPGARREVADIVATMDRPVRLAVVGRVSSGKSTLVNALIGRRIAATAAQDCTRLVTVYAAGAPEGAEAVRRDGSRLPLPVDLSSNDARLDLATTSRIEVTLQTAFLDGITLVDTPGVAGTGTNFQWDSGEVQAAVDADILLYLFRGALRTDDAALVQGFAGATGGRQPTASNTLGLLAHADSFGSGGWGAADPIDQAAASAMRVQNDLKGCFSAVIPVSALLAETVRTGRLTENSARALRAFADADPARLRFFGQLRTDPAYPTLEALSSLLGPYGLNRGRSHAGSAAQLTAWLEERSGVAALQTHLADTLLSRVRQVRAERAMTQLATAARHWGPQASSMVEQAQHSAEMHPIRELRAYRMLLAECPDSFLVDHLADVVSSDEGVRAVRLLGRATDAEARAEALRLSSYFQAQAGLAPRGAEAEAARTLSMSYLHLWHAVSRMDTHVTSGGRR